jgi:DMSO/TMAO reductase YedYZ molybdopterin-dependent catalytic subunit
METRRNFVRRILTAVILGPVLSAARIAYAKAEKIIVPSGTPRETLKNKNPKDLDTTNLEVTPLGEFGTMGLDDLKVDINQWRLLVEGSVGKSLSLSYSELTALPPVEKTVLLICPGFFVNNGVWKGVSIRELLTRADVSEDVNYVTFRGPEGNYEKVFRVPLNDVLTDKVFLAYQVNGAALPRKHGFPLRVVAEGYYGSDWVKYVYKVTADVVRE